jgi:hypothetical protein
MTKQEFISRVLLIMNEAGLYDKEGNSYVGADSAQIDRYIEGSYVDAWRRCAGVMPKSWFKNERFDFYPLISNLTDGTGYVILPNDFYLLNSFKMSSWRKPIFEAFIENERTSSIQSNEYTRGSEIRPVGTISLKDISSIIEGLLLYDVTFWQNDEPEASIDTNTWFDTDTNILKIKVDGAWIDVDFSESPDGSLITFGGKYYSLKNGSTTPTFTEVKISNGIAQVLNYYSVQKGLLSHTISEAIYIPVATSIKDIDGDSDLGLNHRIIEPMAYLSASSVFTIFEKYDIAKALEQRVIEMFPAFKSVKGTNVTFKQ